MVLWAPLAGAADPRTFRVTDAGLVVDRPMLHRFRPWTAFTGYSLSDEALVIHRKGWWRQNLRCDRDDIDDIDAITEALEAVMADRPQSSRKEI
jgi:hypothetical protein